MIRNITVVDSTKWNNPPAVCELPRDPRRVKRGPILRHAADTSRLVSLNAGLINISLFILLARDPWKNSTFQNLSENSTVFF